MVAEQNLELDPVKLLIRWKGLGPPLCDIEREVLLISMVEENQKMNGKINRKALKEMQKISVEKSGKWLSYRVQ